MDEGQLYEMQYNDLPIVDTLSGRVGWSFKLDLIFTPMTTVPISRQLFSSLPKIITDQVYMTQVSG